jgi:phytoene dehydrogenase-like protein
MSGLTAAYLMKGHNILLLEKEPALGGRILTAEWEGLRYSMGASYMGEPDKEMKSFFKEIGVKPVPVPPPTDALAYFEEALGSLEEIRDYVRVSKELYKLSAGGIEEAVYKADIDKLAKYEQSGPI